MQSKTLSIFSIERHLKDERWIILSSIFFVSLIAWLTLWGMAKENELLAGFCGIFTWEWQDLLSHFMMWMVMMVAMMLPTASPMILTFMLIRKKQISEDHPYVSTANFISGYLIISFVYSLLITLIQGWLHNNAYLSPIGVINSPSLSGALLITAGLYQWTSLKEKCLSLCRNPFEFFMKHWKEGRFAALSMGVYHGAFCIGCCWVLMALAFVAGAMNLLWMIVLTFIILFEKILPKGDLFAKATGIILIGSGLYFFTLEPMV